MHKLFSSCIRRYLVSRACDWVMPALSAVLLTFSFQFSLLFFNILLTRPHQNIIYGARPHQHCSILLDDIGQRMLPKIWASPFLVRSLQPRKKTQVILIVKMETRHAVGGPFGREFSAFVITAELWQPEVTRPGNSVNNFCIFKNDLSQTVDTAHLAHTVPDFIQIGSLSVELLPIAWRPF